MNGADWPDWTRRTQASTLFFWSEKAAGIVRVDSWPSWWQPTGSVLDDRQPVLLGDVGGDAVLAAELVFVRDRQQGIPINRRVVMSRIRLAGRRRGSEIEPLARLRTHLRRVDKPIAAHPEAVIGLRQIRHQIAALVVRDDDAPELRRQVGKCSPSPTYPQVPQPTKDLISMR
jgi:hypothetical protein